MADFSNSCFLCKRIKNINFVATKRNFTNVDIEFEHIGLWLCDIHVEASAVVPGAGCSWKALHD